MHSRSKKRLIFSLHISSFLKDSVFLNPSFLKAWLVRQSSLLWVVTIFQAQVCWFKAGCHVCSPRAVTLNRPDLHRKTRETAYNLFNLLKRCHDTSKPVWDCLWQVPRGTQVDTTIVTENTGGLHYHGDKTLLPLVKHYQKFTSACEIC